MKFKEITKNNQIFCVFEVFNTQDILDAMDVSINTNTDKLYLLLGDETNKKYLRENLKYLNLVEYVEN